MEQRTDMDTIDTVMRYLKEKGYDNEFTINEDGRLVLNNEAYEPASIKLIRTFRFEGESDPSEQSILYLIETSDGKVGYSVDAYGMYSTHMNDAYSAFINKVTAE